jgi:hypothetical protein
MRGIEVSLVIATAVALAAAGYVLLSDREQVAQMQALERELAEMRAQEAAPNDGVTKITPAPSTESSPLNAATATAESDLADQVAALGVAVQKLEVTARELDSRITRSRLAVPSDEERKAQIQRGQTRLEELRKSADAAREKARQIAVSLKAPFDEKRLLEPGMSPALEEKPEFVGARDAAAAQERVVALFEKKLTELQFSTLVEAVTPDDER